MITLQPMTYWHLLRVLPWRWKHRDGLRTKPGTPWSQWRFYRNVIRNPKSPHRYWSVMQDGRLVGMAGLVNGSEISLITNGQGGIGGEAVRLVLEQTTRCVWGEVYTSNPAVGFWRSVVHRYGGWWDNQPVVSGGREAYRFGLMPQRRAA